MFIASFLPTSEISIDMDFAAKQAGVGWDILLAKKVAHVQGDAG